MDKTKVLVVDDNPTNLMVARRTVESTGVECIEASSGPAALEQIACHDVATVVLDICMPGMDGFETARKMREIPGRETVPIIFLTSIDRLQKNITKGYEAGAIDFLFKPVQSEILACKLRGFVEIHEKNEIIRKQAQELELHVAKLEAFNETLEKQDRRVEQLRETRRALVESELQFRTLMNNLPGATYRRPGTGPWIFKPVSDNIGSLTGYPVERFILDDTFHFEDLILEEDRLLVESKIRSAIKNNEPFTVEYRIRQSNGTLIWVRDHGCGLRNIDGELEWIDGVIFDATLDKEREQDLIRAKEEAEAVHRAKAAFFANISHELRTPLGHVLSFSSFGINKIDGDREKLLGWFELINQSATLLHSFVDELLDISKMDAAKMEFSFGNVDLSCLISSVIMEFSTKSEELGVSIDWDPNSGPLPVKVDRKRIQQVLRNLISNALKFCEPGGRVSVAAKVDSPVVYVTVRDSGTGIPEGELDSIFEEFVQSTQTEDGSGGTGLGLAISRRILQAHDGRIWAENNNDDGGASFHFALPYDADTTIDREVSPLLNETELELQTETHLG